MLFNDARVYHTHPSQCLELMMPWLDLGSPAFSLSYLIGLGLARTARRGASCRLQKAGVYPQLWELNSMGCVSVRPVKFSSSAGISLSSWIRDPADGRPKGGWRIWRLKTEGPSLRLWKNREGGSWEKHSFNSEKTRVLCWAEFQVAKWMLPASHSCFGYCHY